MKLNASDFVGTKSESVYKKHKSRKCSINQRIVNIRTENSVYYSNPRKEVTPTTPYKSQVLRQYENY